MSTRMDRKWCDNKSMSVVANYEPCEKCEELFRQGTRIIEVETEPVSKGQPAMQEGVYPTGHIWVMESKAAEEAFGTDSPNMFILAKEAKAIGLYDIDKKEVE